ncbi:MAG: GAF domain-containing sensor histidine kinase [Anaerolineaceae bacterium]
MSEEQCGRFESLYSDQNVLSDLRDTNQQACDLLHLQVSIIFLWSGKKFITAASQGCDTEKVEINPESMSIQALRSGKTSIKWNRWEPCDDQELTILFDSLEVDNGLLVPLFENSKLSGIWLAAAQGKHLISETDELVLHTLSQNITLIIKNFFITTENLHNHHEIEALYKIGTEISQLQEIDQVLELIVEKACDLLNAEISYLALADDEAQMIRVCVTHGTRGDALRSLTHKYGEGVGGNVAVTRMPVIVNNYPNGEWPKPPGIPDLVATEDIISSLCVPMCTRRGLVGVLYAASRHEDAFTQSHLNLLQALGTQAAIAIENARLYDEQKASNESLREGISTNERLLSLVLDNQGLQGIADTLSDLVHCPILVEDSRFRILCSSLHGYPEADQTEIQALRVSSIDFCHTPELSESLALLQNTRHSIRVTQNSQLGSPLSRIIVPIVTGVGLVGYVSVLETGQPLSAQKHSTTEQASIVFALEFVKQEAARTNLLQHVINAQEEERKRIARELHDETSQALTALMVGLDTTNLALAVNSKEATSRLSAAKSIAEGLLKDIQRIIADLRPSLLDDLGLVPAIAWYGEQRLKPLGITFILEGNALENRLPSSMEAALFRIVQEAITNVIRHAHASKVSVRLDIQDNYLTLQVTDNGMGFDPKVLQTPNSSGKALGLWGIQERIRILEGEFELQTAPGKGTTIAVQVPVP